MIGENKTLHVHLPRPLTALLFDIEKLIKSGELGEVKGIYILILIIIIPFARENSHTRGNVN